MEKKELSPDDYLRRAQAYCARAERAPFEVRQKLHIIGAKAMDIENIVEKLTQDGFLDEARYAAAFVHDKVLFQGWGKQKIRMALLAKKIPEQLVGQALENITPQDYQRALKKALQTKRSASQEQRIRFLLQRGFSYQDIASVSPS